MEKLYPIEFKWTKSEPDRRQWKAASPTLEPQFVNVVVEVPMDDEHFYNLEQLSQSDSSTVVLTLTGWRYCQEKLLEYSQDEKLPVDDELWAEDNNEEWE